MSKRKPKRHDIDAALVRVVKATLAMACRGGDNEQDFTEAVQDLCGYFGLDTLICPAEECLDE